MSFITGYFSQEPVKDPVLNATREMYLQCKTQPFARFLIPSRFYLSVNKIGINISDLMKLL